MKRSAGILLYKKENNLKVTNEIYFLASKKVVKNKLAIMFYSYYDGEI